MTQPSTHHTSTHHMMRISESGAGIYVFDETTPPLLVAPVDAHRRLRGPYTAAGTLLRAVVPDALARFPDLVRAHDIEILTAAPELRAVIDATHETLTSLAVPEERTRFYSRMRTLRLAHGMTEFLRDYVRAAGTGTVSLALERVGEADQTDQELVSVLVRRLDPAEITLVLGFSADPDPESTLGRAVARYARRDVIATAAVLSTLPAEPARRYVESECTAADRRLGDAYSALPAAERAALHDERAEELAALGEKSLTLGAIPYHLERGSDPEKGVAALRDALNYCIDMGFYEATVDFGVRGRAVIDWSADPAAWWVFTTKMTTSLAALGRPEEAEDLYDEARAFSVLASVHMQAAYATAMLYTRHHDEERKDHTKALGWINQAIAFANAMQDPESRAVNTVFHRNGRALIEAHLGRPEEALRLVAEGLALLDAELDADKHRLHRSVLRYNRAQVYVGLGRLDEAVVDYTDVIAEDPNYSEYHFDLGNLLRRVGRDLDAMAEYETAMRLSPPFPELYYNRGDLLAALGNPAGAIADFRYVLEIDPEYVDAHLNLAGLLADYGDPDAASEAVVAGLAVAPDNPHLHCLVARLALQADDPVAAEKAVQRALAADPAPAEAWALSGTLAYQSGDLAGAAEALARSAELKPDPAVLFNLGAVRQELGLWEQAIEAYGAALELDPDDPDTWLSRSWCLARTGQAEAAAADIRRFEELAPERAAEALLP
jgi:tetratricopeptide (TPR) repeat protein